VKLDDLFCFDCAMSRATFDVDCAKHTPLHLQSVRAVRVQEALRTAAGIITRNVRA
jgi:hypothetical protein